MPVVALVAACTTEPVARAPAPVAELAPAPAVAPPRPTAPAITRIDPVHTWGMTRTICLHDAAGGKDCFAIGWEWQRLPPGSNDKPRGHLVRHPAGTEGDQDYVYATRACKHQRDTLSCEGAEAITGVESHGSYHYGYLRAGDRILWYANWLDLDDPAAGTTRVLRDMRAFPGGVRALTVGFRAACVMAGDASVWCWSNPRRPRRATVPANTVDIFVQDPFQLCARTADGVVTCNPAFAQPDLACSKKNDTCGIGGYSADGDVLPMRRPFDPIKPLLRPQSPLELGHAALRLVRDDTDVSAACRGRDLGVDSTAVGGCAIGPAGELSCFTPCNTTWDVYRITGVPPVAEAWLDDHTGYARTRDGALYAWPNPRRDRQVGTCTSAPDVAATHLPELDGISQLTDALPVVRGPNWTANVRCAIATAGVRCWYPGDDGMPANIADPRTLAEARK